MGGPVGTPGRFFVMEGFREAERRGGVLPRPGAFLSLFSFCLRRVTFVSSDKSNQKRHSRGKEVSIFLPP